MKIKFLEPAFQEYNEAMENYELRSEGLGSKFKEQIGRTIKIIKRHSQGFSKFTIHTRKAIINILPYNIICWFFSLPDSRSLIILCKR